MSRRVSPPMVAAMRWRKRSGRAARMKPMSVRGVPHQQIVDGQANPGDGKALRPARIAILAAALWGGLQQLFDVGDGFGFGEARFVQINLEAVFDGTHQLDAVEGAEVQVRFEICPRRRSRGAASRGDARD